MGFFRGCETLLWDFSLELLAGISTGFLWLLLRQYIFGYKARQVKRQEAEKRIDELINQ